MLGRDHIEELIGLLTTWDRETLTSRFLSFKSSFPVDCTPEFLQDLSIDRIRHVFFALCVQNSRMPDAADCLLASQAA